MGLIRSRLTLLTPVMLFSGIALYLLNRNPDLSRYSLDELFNDMGAWSEVDEPPQQPPYGAVVAAGSTDINLSWMADTSFNHSWDIFPYSVEEPQDANSRLHIPKNKGHEAMVYLSYIIDNYDSLPWMTVFVHGHREAWHQEQPVDLLINKLKRKALAREGYITLRCDWYPSCPAEIRPHGQDAIVWGPGVKRKETEQAIVGNWRMIFPGERMPDTIASPCCAQFAVTQKAIQGRPRSDYERMRIWLLETAIVDDVSGRVFEKLWAYIFTGRAVHCPPPQQCACEFFEDCASHNWQEPPEGLPLLPTWP